MTTSTVAQFQPGRRINIPSVPNLRDIGGYATVNGGRVRLAQLYRSTELDRLGSEDLEAFAALSIRTVFDLRTAIERKAAPDVVPEGTEQVVCDVLEDSKTAAPAQLLKLLSHPSRANQMLGHGNAVKLFFEQAYREIVHLPSALSSYRRFFTYIPQDAHRPALFHWHHR